MATAVFTGTRSLAETGSHVMENRAVPPTESIDWRRMAAPQADQYDTTITLEFARAGGYVRAEVETDETTFDGRVAVVRHREASWEPRCMPAPPGHPNVSKACELVRRWPAVFTQCQHLLEAVSVFVDIRSTGDEVMGSISGSIGDRFGRIGSTVDNHVGLAESLVHEMAHHKLRALGVAIESANRLVTNHPDQRFMSPIILDRLRPMTAVLHAQYSFTYVLGLDIEIIRAGQDAARDRTIAAWSLAHKLPRLEFSLALIRDHIAVDPAGEQFLEGYFRWFDEIQANAHRILDEFGIPPVPFIHPLDLEAGVANEEEWFARHPRPRAGIDAHPVSDEIVLYSSDLQKAFSLNGSAAAIWSLCDGSRSVSDIGRTLEESFGSTDGLLLHDIREAVIQFGRLGLLEWADVSDRRGAA
jgi:hypothetical protein